MKKLLRKKYLKIKLKNFRNHPYKRKEKSMLILIMMCGWPYSKLRKYNNLRSINKKEVHF